MSMTLVLVAIAALAAYLYNKVRHARFEQYKEIPQLKTSLVWGHLKVMNDFLIRREPDRHPNYIFDDMAAELGHPDAFLVDIRPVGWPMLIVNNHELAEQFSKSSKAFPWSVTKSPTMYDLVHLIGPRSILMKEADEWKHSRKTFNPGFAPNHLLTLLPAILDKTDIFVERLDEYAASAETFGLLKPLINLTFDIIGAVVMDVDCNAQARSESDRSDLVKLFEALGQTYNATSGGTPWWFTPRIAYRRRVLSAKIDALLGALVREKHATLLSSPTKSRSVLALSLHDTPVLTPASILETSDQLKTFLFAGHDTTSILTSWMYYYLSQTPRALAAVRAELDAVLGPDPSPSAVRAALLAPGGSDLVARMTYCSAVIKETLRLQPPGGSARLAPVGSGLTAPVGPGGKTACVDGLVIYMCHSSVQRDRRVFGDNADEFVPERWLGDADTSEKTNEEDGGKGKSGIPAGAWRPFERGPRNCVGQELANIEARVILAVTVRRYDFDKVGLGAFELDGEGKRVLGENGVYKVKSELYSTMQVTSKPADMMMVKVALTDAAKAAGGSRMKFKS
ncbi:putative sterigmatocystin biosynthesis P450 monooxygenase stcS [Podospora conica]|nr:putative sterigmatocystin biosynthesis P450 monooxygenase stcS [Schizothecium conicum]